MANRSRFPAARSRAPKRKVLWVGTATTADATVAAGLSVIHSSFDPSSLGILQGTIVRTRGLFQAFPVAFTADANWTCAYGLCIVSDEAFAAGAASIPRPHDDDDWPGWLVHGYFSGHVEFSSGTSVLVVPQMWEINSKAMRKVSPNETAVWMIESNSGPDLLTFLQARVLMKLA